MILLVSWFCVLIFQSYNQAHCIHEGYGYVKYDKRKEPGNIHPCKLCQCQTSTSWLCEEYTKCSYLNCYNPHQDEDKCCQYLGCKRIFYFKIRRRFKLRLQNSVYNELYKSWSISTNWNFNIFWYWCDDIFPSNQISETFWKISRN